MTKPLVFNYKYHEELRQAYKELLADNQQLIADNRKLRQEVTELKQLNDGYVKIIAKNQETNNKLMASVQKQTVPTVIRAKTFMRKEDFDKWAEDIKRQNKSVVCIPCDAEVISADAVQLVRCKDCRWYEPKYKDKEYDCPQGLYSVYADDYCSHGERKDK